MPRADEGSGLLVNLTDHAVIAAEVKWLRAEGHGELAVWRHFLEHFVVDLDALSRSIAMLFGTLRDGDVPHPAADQAAIVYRQAA